MAPAANNVCLFPGPPTAQRMARPLTCSASAPAMLLLGDEHPIHAIASQDPIVCCCSDTETLPTIGAPGGKAATGTPQEQEAKLVSPMLAQLYVWQRALELVTTRSPERCGALAPLPPAMSGFACLRRGCRLK